MRAATPAAAVARQTRLAEADCRALYAFTVSAFPVTLCGPVFAKSADVRRQLVRSAGDASALAAMAAGDKAVARLDRALRLSRQTIEKHQQRLRLMLTKQRLRFFAADFAVRRRFGPMQTARCTFCDQSRPTATLPCCARPDDSGRKALCGACLESAAFYSSQHGTQPKASCPFCRAAFDVYGPLPPTASGKRKRADAAECS